VRASSLRGTLHILTAEDYLLVQPLLQRALSSSLNRFIRRTEGFKRESFIAQIRAYVQEQPRTSVELRAQDGGIRPGMGEASINDAVRILPGAPPDSTRWHLGFSPVARSTPRPPPVFPESRASAPWGPPL